LQPNCYQKVASWQQQKSQVFDSPTIFFCAIENTLQDN